jgi:chorismate mutase
MDISEWRRKIDQIDLKLVELLNERTQCSVEIGRWKHGQGHPAYDPEREKEILERVSRASKGPLEPGAVKRLFERIIDEARRAARIAVSGDTGSGNPDQR